MKAKYIYLTVLLAIGFSFGNCDFDNCDCSGIKQFFDINGMVLSHAKLDKNLNKDEFPELDTVTFEEYGGLLVKFDVNYIAQASEKRSWNFSLINSALACSCPPNGFKGAKNESFKNINVITLNDYNDAHLAGSSLNDILSVSMNNSSLTESLFDLLNRNEFIQGERYFLKPGTKSTNNAPLKLKVEIELSNGEIYTDEAYEVLIE